MSQIEHRKRLTAARQQTTFDPTFRPVGGRRPAPPTDPAPVPEPFVEQAAPAPPPRLAPGAEEVLSQVANGGARVDEGDGFDLNPAALAQPRQAPEGVVAESEDERFLQAAQGHDPNPTE